MSHDPAAEGLAAAALHVAKPIAQSAVASSVTGTTAETTLASITIPAGSMGANGQVEIEALWSYNNSANSKTLRVRFGATPIMFTVSTTSASLQSKTRIGNRNSVSSQVGPGSPVVSTSGSAVVTATENTAADVVITLTAQLALSTETVTLESYVVKLYPKN